MKKTTDIDGILCEAMIRADVYHYYDPRITTIYFVSRNEKEPLTNEEKTLITNRLTMKLPTLKVEFKN